VGGLCLPENEGLQRFPGGYCAARANSTACNRAARETEERPGRVQARPLPINLMGRIATVFLKRCKSTADCRAEYVCEAAYEVCLPDRPVQLAMNAQYEPASICVEDYEKEP